MMANTADSVAGFIICNAFGDGAEIDHLAVVPTDSSGKKPQQTPYRYARSVVWNGTKCVIDYV
jgi:hypothetical protein